LSEVSSVVKKFIEDYIDSVDALEILLLLRDKPDKEWGPPAISSALSFGASNVSLRLSELKSAGMIRERTSGHDHLYQYGPSTAEMALAINELAKAYSTYRVRIIGMIFSKPMNRIRTFSDVTRSAGDEGEI
jgi:hypothetical protein